MTTTKTTLSEPTGLQLTKRDFFKLAAGAAVTVATATPTFSALLEVAEPAVVSGFNTPTNAHLIRSQIWSREIRELLKQEFLASRYTHLTKETV